MIPAMIKRIAGLAVVVLGLAGCQGANTRDLEGIKGQDPPKIEIYNNIDGHPNPVRLCIDGVALLTTTRDLSAVTLVPAWDGVVQVLSTVGGACLPR